MYTIAGKLGFKRGPYTVEQVRDKIASGRFTARTRARRQGSSKWQPLSGFPEFADAFQPAESASTAHGQAFDTTRPTSPGAGNMQAWADAILARGYAVDLVSCFTHSLEVLLRAPWVMVGATLVALIVFALIDFILNLVFLGAIHMNPTVHQIVGTPIGTGIVCGLVALFLWVIRTENAQEMVIQVGEQMRSNLGAALRTQCAAVRDRAKGQRPLLTQVVLVVLALSGPLAFLVICLTLGRYVPASTGVIGRLVIGLGRLVVAAPAAYFVVLWWFAPVLAFDKGLKIREALELSRRVVRPHCGAVATMVALVLGLGYVGYALCYVGMLGAVPVGLGATLYLYEEIFGIRPAPAEPEAESANSEN